MRRSCKALLATILAPATIVAAAPLAHAGDPCDSLWYKRNAIYAAAGHCFKTARAISVFGPGCFPPYGKLTPSQQRRVNRISAQERKFGC